tara:strand:- start:1001 stop:1234 length:234 start_codon:yes stop_codon:yes gene_type:complete
MKQQEPVNLQKLKQRHGYLNKKVAKMERERERTRDVAHKEMLKAMKKEKLMLKDEIHRLEQIEFNYDEHQGGVESFR